MIRLIFFVVRTLTIKYIKFCFLIFNIAQASSPLEVHPSTNTQPSLVKKANSSLQVTPDPVVPSTTALSSEGQYGSSIVAGSLHQNIHIAGGKMSQLQKGKPSGLRMPSPSLGYFGQV